MFIHLCTDKSKTRERFSLRRSGNKLKFSKEKQRQNLEKENHKIKAPDNQHRHLLTNSILSERTREEK